MANPRTINLPGSRLATQQYELAPGLAQYVQSVYVEVDNTAGADTRPTLTLSEQSGVVIAKKRQGDSIPAGGTGSATWALRLTDETAPATSAAASWCTAQVNPAPIDPGSSSSNYFNLHTNDAVAFSLDVNGFLVIGKAGTYSVEWGWFASTTFLGGPVANPWTLFVQGGSGSNVGTLIADLGGPSTSGVVLSTTIQTWQNTFGRVITVSSGQVGGSFNFNWNNNTTQTLAVRGGVFVTELS